MVDVEIALSCSSSPQGTTFMLYNEAFFSSSVSDFHIDGSFQMEFVQHSVHSILLK